MKKTLFLFILLVSVTCGFLTGGDQAEPKVADETKPPAKVGRAFIEMGINLTYSAVNYWSKYARFVEDWQFTLSWKDQRRKFFTSEGLRLDSNNMRLNWTHAWSGALYYNWARSNRLGPGSSFLFSAGGSLFWEYFAEWREISSINDHIFTSLGGLSIGEPMFQIASHFRSRSGLANRVACLIFDTPLAINDFLDGKGRLPRTPIQDRNDFRLSIGGKQGPGAPLDDSSSHADFNLDLRLVTLPGYGRPGTGSGFSKQAIDNGFRVSFSFNNHLAGEFSMSTRCVLGGWWWKNLRAGEDGTLSGSESWLGAVTAWELFQKKPVVPYDGNDLGIIVPWFEREQPTRYTDKYSTVHILGPAFSWTGYAGKLSARADLEATFDFSMVNSLPYNDYSGDHDVWGVKTTLHNWGYYYSLGYTLGARFDLRRGPFRAEGGIKYQRFRSIQGLDRFQKDILDDSPLKDSRLVYDAGLSIAIPRTPLFLSLNLEGIDRWGCFHEVSARTHEMRFFYRLGVRF